MSADNPVSAGRRALFKGVAAALGVGLLPNDVCIEGDGKMRVERRGRLLWFVDRARVNIDDLLHANDGRIVRCVGDPRECVMVYDADSKRIVT